MTTTHFPRRTGAPAAEPLTLAEALVHLRADADAGPNDAYVTSLIAVARAACEERTERSLITTAWRLHLPAFPSDGVILLRVAPIIEVQSVQYLDAAGVLQTLAADQYQLDPHAEPGRLSVAPGATWPATQTGADAAVRVNFTAGYGATGASVPAPLKHWMLLAIGEMYELRSGSSDKPAVRHDFADALLQPFRLLGV
jgi:uncharacterized phiE125 gp8 family phage protein